MVNLELYRVFYTVAKCGSLTKAGEELYISQPAVSQAIKQLENQLGGQLFNRTHKGMQLSKNGEKIFELVEQALKLLNQAEKTFSTLTEMATGELTICASDTISTHFLMPFIKKYHEKFPEVKLVLQNGTTSQTIENLKNKKGDVGFVNLPINDEQIELISSVMCLHDIFVASEKFSDLSQGEVDLKKLQEYPLLMLELPTVTGQAVSSFASSIGIKLNPEIELASIELMISMAKNGLGIACVPKEFVSRELFSEKSLFEIKTKPAIPNRSVGLVVNKDEDLSYIVKEFIKLIQESNEEG